MVRALALFALLTSVPLLSGCLAGAAVGAAVTVATLPIKIGGEIVEGVVDDDEKEKTAKERAREERRRHD